jgi:hypothetical protein
MVSVNLKGGLCNMLFQIAFIEDLARRGGFEVRYPDIDQVFSTLLKSGHSQNCYDYLNIFKNFDWKKNQDKPMPNRIVSIPHHYEYIEPVDNMIYDGYFQSERYFDRAETLKLFEPNLKIEAQIALSGIQEISDSSSVHIRRGDYLRYSDTYQNLGMDYYLRAMNFTESSFYFICSDEIKTDLPDYLELFMMSKCNHNIIANSSFSWWGAYLNQNPDKKVIAPAKWYKPGCRYSAKDIYTSNMIIV